MKPNNKRALSILFAIVLLFASFNAYGEDADASNDPNLGIWNAVSLSMLGLDMEVSEVFDLPLVLELKDGGAVSIEVEGEKGNGTWEYLDDKILLSIDGIDMTVVVVDGALKLENMLDMGMDITFAKDGQGDGQSDDQGDGQGASIVDAAANRDAGYYVIHSITLEGDLLEAEDLDALEIDYYMLLNEDGSALISTNEVLEGTWGKGKINYQQNGEEFYNDYTLEDDLLTIAINSGNTILVFKRSNDTAPE